MDIRRKTSSIIIILTSKIQSQGYYSERQEQDISDGMNDKKMKIESF